MRLRTIPGALALLLALLAPATGAGAGPPPGPFPVLRASLTQKGRQLAWSVELGHPFAPTLLNGQGRSLCLLIERAVKRTLSGVVCVGAGRGVGAGGGAGVALAPVLRYFPVTAAGRGRARQIAATFSRAGSDQLTASFLPADAGIRYTATRWQVASGFSGSAQCSPALTGNPAGCVAPYPAGPALTKLHTPILVGCVPSGAPYVTNGPASGRELALTFDDGPWYQTAQFLAVLERMHAVATFFQIGRQISSFGHGGAIERRMLADGDMIGDHTWSHPDVAGAGAFARIQIEQTAAAIHEATGGFTPCLFRAPGGATSPGLIALARSLGFTTIQWDIDPRDWSLPGAGAIYGNVIANARPGAIAIQHDGGGDRSQTLAALPREIATLRARGYRLVTVTQLLGQRLIYR